MRKKTAALAIQRETLPLDAQFGQSLHGRTPLEDRLNFERLRQTPAELVRVEPKLVTYDPPAPVFNTIPLAMTFDPKSIRWAPMRRFHGDIQRDGVFDPAAAEAAAAKRELEGRRADAGQTAALVSQFTDANGPVIKQVMELLREAGASRAQQVAAQQHLATVADDQLLTTEAALALLDHIDNTTTDQLTTSREGNTIALSVGDTLSGNLQDLLEDREGGGSAANLVRSEYMPSPSKPAPSGPGTYALLHAGYSGGGTLPRVVINSTLFHFLVDDNPDTPTTFNRASNRIVYKPGVTEEMRRTFDPLIREEVGKRRRDLAP